MATTAASLDLSASQIRHRSLGSIVWNQYRRHTMAVAATFVLTLLVAGAILVSVLTPYDRDKSNFRTRYESPSLLHPMGTDDLGRDLLTRILYGSRVSLTVGLLATVVGIVLGSTVGALAGFYGGILDNILMRTADLFLSLPRLFVLIIMTLILRSLNAPLLQTAGGAGGIIIILGITAWMGVARLVRGQFLSLKQKEFAEAARTLGVRNTRIIFRHILPNAATPVIVAATLRVAGAIIAESGLSFLGFGVQPPTPTWGNMLTNAQDEMLRGHWWMAFFPGLMILLTVLSINYIGDGLRDALDPRKLS